MASRKRLEIQPEPGLAQAAEKTRDLIRGLQSRLQAETVSAVPEAPGEPADELERQLHEYFEHSHPNGAESPPVGALNDIRNRVIEGVVERILRAWEQRQSGTAGALQDEVVERLIERVLNRMQNRMQKGAAS